VSELKPVEKEVLRALGEIGLQIRQRAQRDLIFYGSKVLGYDYLDNPPDFMRTAAKIIEDKVDGMYLAPRGHIKTTLFDVVGTSFDWTRNPDIRILLTHGTLENAKRILIEALAAVQCERYRTLFPEFTPETKEEMGTTMKFIVPCRTRPLKEPTIMVAAPGATVTGMHFDRIACSDLVNEQNVPPNAEPEQMQKIIDFFRTFTPLLAQDMPDCRRTIDGTRWHDGDLYGLIANDPAYAHFRKVIISLDTDENGNPVSVWDKMDQERLMRIRSETGEYLWAANYMNDPLPAEGATNFKEEWFRNYDKEPDQMDIAITVDLAISEKTGADYTAIIVSGITPSGDLYVLHCSRGHWRPKEVMDRLFELDAEYSPTYIGVESIAWQRAMIFMLEDEARRRGHFIPVRPLVPDASKIRRAAPLANHAERKGIYIRPGMGDLVHEFSRFPVGAHDDMVDALAYRAQDLWRPDLVVEVEKKAPVLDLSAWRHTGKRSIDRYERRGRGGDLMGRLLGGA
jgi:predicted phage terminase large subunit-like protein